MELVKKRILQRRTSIEYRIMNIECRRNVFYQFYKKIERSETTLRNSAVRYSIFCGSLFGPASEAASFIIKKPCHFGVVSYEASNELNSVT